MEKQTLIMLSCSICLAVFVTAICIYSSNRAESAHKRIDEANARIDVIQYSLSTLKAPTCNSWRPYEDYIPSHDSRSSQEKP